MYVYYNPNYIRKTAGDCVIRAICKVEEVNWNKAFTMLMNTAFHEKDMPSANHVWGKLLKSLGYRKYLIPDTCPDCYTVRGFCYEHPFGRYVLATGSHVVAVVNGDYYDSWDSGEEVPIYYWKEKQ